MLTLPKDLVGFGTMRTTWAATPLSEEEAVEVFYTAYNEAKKHVYENNPNRDPKEPFILYNCGEFYGENFLNLKYMEAFLKKYPEVEKEILICVKGGVNLQTLAPNADKDFIKGSIDNSFKYLHKIDIFENARIDKNVPIEEVFQFFKETYLDTGRIRGFALSEASAESIKKASSVFKPVYAEVEFSLWAREILTNGVYKTAGELNIPLVAYSPLGAGFLTGLISKIDDFPEGDFRRYFDRFSSENMGHNLEVLEKIHAVGKKLGWSMPEIALSWIEHFSSLDGAPIIPLPGSTKAQRIKDNIEIKKMDAVTFKEINDILDSSQIKGVRYVKDAAVQDSLYG